MAFHRKCFWKLYCEKCCAGFTTHFTEKVFGGINCEIQGVSMVIFFTETGLWKSWPKVSHYRYRFSTTKVARFYLRQRLSYSNRIAHVAPWQGRTRHVCRIRSFPPATPTSWDRVDQLQNRKAKANSKKNRRKLGKNRILVLGLFLSIFLIFWICLFCRWLMRSQPKSANMLSKPGSERNIPRMETWFSLIRRVRALVISMITSMFLFWGFYFSEGYNYKLIPSQIDSE